MIIQWSFISHIFYPLLGLAIFLAGRELYKHIAKNQWIRLITYTVLLVALYGLIVPLQYEIIPPLKSVILTDSGYSVADTLVDENTIVFDSFDRWIQTQDQLNIEKLTVLSTGLADWQRASISYPFRFIPLPVPEGITHLSTSTLVEESPTNITGDLIIKDSVTILLAMPTGLQYQMEVEPADPHFHFNVTLPIAGDHLIALYGIRQKDTLFKETYPLKVAKKTQSSILYLSGYPSSEGRYFIQHMIELGYAVTQHQQLTRKKFKTSHYNQQAKNNFRLTKNVLLEYDLIVIEPTGFEQLSPALRRGLADQIERNNIGAIWLGSGELLKKQLNIRTNQTVKPSIEWELSSGTLSLSIQSDPIGHQTINYHSVAIAYVHTSQLGSWVQPAFTDSYRLVLRGATETYRAVWNMILQEAMNAQLEADVYSFDPFASVGYKHTFQLPTQTPISYQLEGFPLRPKQNPHFNNQYEYSYWPERAGWQALYQGDSIEQYVYHSAENGWKTRRMFRDQQLTHLLSMHSQTVQPSRESRYKALDSWWWYTILLSCLAILWIEHRVRS